MATYKNYTKEEIKFVYQNWDKMTGVDMAKRLGRSEASISYIAAAIRKAGYELARKRQYGLRDSIREALGPVK